MPASPRVHDLEDGDFVVACAPQCLRRPTSHTHACASHRACDSHDHFYDVSQLHYDNTIYVFVDSHAKSLHYDR